MEAPWGEQKRTCGMTERDDRAGVNTKRQFWMARLKQPSIPPDLAARLKPTRRLTGLTQRRFPLKPLSFCLKRLGSCRDWTATCCDSQARVVREERSSYHARGARAVCSTTWPLSPRTVTAATAARVFSAKSIYAVIKQLTAGRRLAVRCAAVPLVAVISCVVTPASTEVQPPCLTRAVERPATRAMPIRRDVTVAFSALSAASEASPAPTADEMPSWPPLLPTRVQPVRTT